MTARPTPSTAALAEAGGLVEVLQELRGRLAAELPKLPDVLQRLAVSFFS